MTALRELQEGKPGAAFVELVSRTIRAVAISRNFPPPGEYDAWTTDAVATAAAGFFASPQTPRRLDGLSLKCPGDDGLRRRIN